MGCTQSTALETTTPTKIEETDKEQAPEQTIVEVELKKHRPGCTGMFWRSDPTRKTMLMSNDHWPRDHAKLRGYPVVVDDEKWLLCTQVRQKGESMWHKAPTGAAMPFEYYDHYYLE